jgi:hypothetical protein
MRQLNWFSGAAALAIAAFAVPASAATWSLQKNITAVEITDDTNNGGSQKVLNIFLSSAGTYCGTSQSVIAIKQSETTLWDQWIRMSESALLSGRQLQIYSSNATGSCKAWSIILKE